MYEFMNGYTSRYIPKYLHHLFLTQTKLLLKPITNIVSQNTYIYMYIPTLNHYINVSDKNVAQNNDNKETGSLEEERTAIVQRALTACVELIKLGPCAA